MKFSGIILMFLFFATVAEAKGIFQISGVDAEIEKNILSYLATITINCQSTQAQLDLNLKQINTKTSTAIQPFGYYEAQINVGMATRKDDCWLIPVRVNLGEPTVIRNLDIQLVDKQQQVQKNPLFSTTFALKKGDRLLHSEYEKFKTNLLQQAFEYGYLDAKFMQNTIEVFPEQRQADMVLHFYTGVRYKIENISVKQDSVFLTDEFILKLIDLQQGDYFTNSQLFNLNRKLSSSGYFEQVSIKTENHKRANGLVPIMVSVKPGDRIRYSTGIGYSTDAGPRVLLDYNQLRITDFGYQFDAKLTLSNIISEISTGLKMPAKSQPMNKWYNVDVGYRRETSTIVDSDTIKLGLSQTRIKTNKWQNIYYIDLVNEQFDTGGVQNESNLLLFGSSWSYTQADNPRRPSKGFKLQADIKTASQAIISDVSFVQLGLNYKHIFSTENNNRVIYRGQLGTTLVNSIKQLPSSYRYFTGGDNSIRGYNYNTLSPIDDAGIATGGKHLFISSLEYENRITGQWAVATFTDFGSSFTDEFKLNKSIGAGLRWFSPIGPVRFDVGFPINNSAHDFQIHISIGPDF